VSTWAIVMNRRRFEAERLIHHDSLDLTGLNGEIRPAPGDEVAVIVDGEPPLVVALGRVRPAAADEDDPDDPLAGDGTAPLVVTYTRLAFDDPVPAEQLELRGVAMPLDRATYRRLADRLGPPRDRRTWLVSLDLPIEAPSAAEAVRVFWSYVMELGPRELPAFVSPAGDELAMQAFVLGEEANQDPEEDD
jgi:hypothetical protein